jgi:putative SOS response-associated peptidase YedK
MPYLFEPYPPDEFVAYPVNPIVNNVKNQGPDCIESKGELF